MSVRFKEDAKLSKIFFDIGGNIGNYSVLYRKVSDGSCFFAGSQLNILDSCIF